MVLLVECCGFLLVFHGDEFGKALLSFFFALIFWEWNQTVILMKYLVVYSLLIFALVVFSILNFFWIDENLLAGDSKSTAVDLFPIHALKIASIDTRSLPSCFLLLWRFLLHQGLWILHPLVLISVHLSDLSSKNFIFILITNTCLFLLWRYNSDSQPSFSYLAPRNWNVILVRQ